MGSGISDNYNNIKPTFTSRYWKVHSAIKKSTGEEVSLWLLDSKEVKQASSSKITYQKYIDSCIESVNKLRRLHHPNILQIYEVSDNPKQFGFSSERVEGTLGSDKTLDADDITYVADQLAQGLSFIHDGGRMLHLGLSPDSICITKAINVKICAFNYATLLETGNEVKPSYGDYIEGDELNPEICYTAPEYLEKKMVSPASDVFSYGACLFAAYNKKGPVYVATTTEEVVVTVSASAFKTPTNMNDPMHDLLLKCVSYKPEDRPTLVEISKSPAFFQLSIRSLRFLSLLATKELDDRLHFFQNIVKSLSLFSDRLLFYNILPTFVNEVKTNDIYGPVLIPVIFHIGSKLSTENFMSEVIDPLSSTLKKCFPPALAIATLNVTNIIIQKVPEDKQFDLIYPIFINSLQSSSKELRIEAIKNIPIVVSAMTENAIITSLLPTLLDFVSSFDDVEIVRSVIQCIGECSSKVNADQYSFIIMPKLMICWVRIPQQPIAEAIINILENIQSSITSKMKFIIPMATAILTTQHLPKEIIVRIGNLIDSTIDQLRTERNLEERAANWRPANDDAKDEVQLKAPIKVDQIDQEKIVNSRRRSSMISDPSSSGPGSLSQQQSSIAAQIQAQQQAQQQSLFQSQPPPQQQLPPSNEESFGNVSNELPQEGKEKRRTLKSFFGFGKKKNADNIEDQSLAQSSFDTTSVAPRTGPPGPLPGSLPSSHVAQNILPPSTVAPRGGPPGPPPSIHHNQPQQQQGSLYSQQQGSLYAQQPQQGSLYSQPQQQQQQGSLYSQPQQQQGSLYSQQPQQQQGSLYQQQPQSQGSLYQPQAQPQQSLYSQQQQQPQQQSIPVAASGNYNSTGSLPVIQQPQQPQQSNLFAGMTQGPAPKKQPPSNQSLFSGLNMRTKK